MISLFLLNFLQRVVVSQKKRLVFLKCIEQVRTFLPQLLQPIVAQLHHLRRVYQHRLLLLLRHLLFLFYPDLVQLHFQQLLLYLIFVLPLNYINGFNTFIDFIIESKRQHLSLPICLFLRVLGLEFFHVLLLHQFLKDFHLCHFLIIFRNFPFNNDRVSVLQSILSSPPKPPHHLRPVLLPLRLEHQFYQQFVLLLRPVPLLYVRVQEAVPVLSALFSAPINFIFVRVLIEKLLRNLAPIFFPVMPNRYGSCLHDQLFEEGLLPFLPFLVPDFAFAEGKPLEHAHFGGGAGDEERNLFPILLLLNKEIVTMPVQTSRIFFLSQYLATTQTNIFRSWLLQFLLTFLFFIILPYTPLVLIDSALGVLPDHGEVESFVFFALMANMTYHLMLYYPIAQLLKGLHKFLLPALCHIQLIYCILTKNFF